MGSKSNRYSKRAVLSIVPILMLHLVMSGCALFPQGSHVRIAHVEQPIVSAYQPYRVIQVCLDTPPISPAQYFHATAAMIADRIDEVATVNQGGLVVYVSLIEHDSLQTSVLTITVPPVPADPQKPVLEASPDPSSYQNPYDLSAAVDRVNKANAALLDRWQSSLKQSHQALALIRESVKKQTDRLRGLSVPYDNTGADVYGCLDLASTHFQGVKAVKTLLIVSPLVNNTSRQEISGVDLSGASVVVIYHSCPQDVASICLANDSYWKRMFLQFHAGSVKFYDPAQTQAEKPTF